MSGPNARPDDHRELPPEMPLDYAPTNLDARPTRSTVMAIIGIIYAGIALLGGLMGLFSLAMIPVMTRVVIPTTGPTSAPAVNFNAMTSLMIWSVILSLTGAALAVILLIGSIRLLRNRLVGLQMMRTWAWIEIIYSVIATVLGIWLQYEMQQKVFAQIGTGMPSGFMTVALITGAVFGIAFRMILPVLILTLLRGEMVKRVLQ